MNTREDNQARSPALAGSAKLIAGIAILLVAGMAILVVLDAISLEMFGALTKKILLTASIVTLASIAIGLLARIGKP
jgi:hypothetical protein